MFLPHVLNTETFRVEKNQNVDKGYAILSHRWHPNFPETTFDMLPRVDLRQVPKIKGACDTARALGYEWIWIDNICIDKDSSAELTKSLNSMFEWYSKADVCLTYLWDVDITAHGLSIFGSCEDRGKDSDWFTRGWTLQELLAPRSMKFYDRNWRLIDEKKNRLPELELATGIDKRYLQGGTLFREVSIATRMSWMAGRHTTLPEDIAYSMLGILDTTIEPRYGEGVKAFTRIQRELIDNSTDESIFAWTSHKDSLQCYQRTEAWVPSSWGLLAPSPDCFRDSKDVVLFEETEIEPRLGGGYRWAQQGVMFNVPQKSGTEATNFFGLPRKEVKFALNCRKGRSGTVVLHLEKSGSAYKRVKCHDLDPKVGAKPSNNRSFGIEQIITRPLIVLQPQFA